MTQTERHQPESSAQEVRQRKKAFVALLAMTPPGGALFAVVNLNLGAEVLAALSVALIATAIVVSILLLRGVSLQTLALIYLAVLYINIFAGVARPEIHPGTTSSVPLLPVLAYLLLEKRMAFPVTALSILAVVGAYVWGGQVAPYRFEGLLIAHVTLPTISLFIVCHLYARNRARTVSEMLERAFRDPLTGLWNREKLEMEFERERDRVRRTGQPLSMLMIDLDNFKSLNDRYGHDAGDAGLTHFARLLTHRLRATDLGCRVGGEEFAVLLPDTGIAGARVIAEELRHSLAAESFEHRGTSISMTATAGIAELERDGGKWEELFRVVDTRLYAGKRAGKNRVVSEDSEDRSG